MKARDVLKLLEKNGWVLKSTAGSHRQFVHRTKPGKMKKYVVIFEESSNGWGAFVPDLPGCVALGFTLDETKNLIREVVEQHLAAMRADGDEIPEPSYVEFVEVA